MTDEISSQRQSGYEGDGTEKTFDTGGTADSAAARHGALSRTRSCRSRSLGKRLYG